MELDWYTFRYTLTFRIKIFYIYFNKLRYKYRFRQPKKTPLPILPP